MLEDQFKLVTNGKIIEGFTPTQVQQNLRAHLKLPEVSISSIFSGNRTVIKKGVDAVTAQKYIKQFLIYGLVVERESIALALEKVPAALATPDKPALATPDKPAATLEEATEYPQALAFEFSGEGKEYFKIWIVNIVLTILTLGIYSAWAKVRNKQYFYGNTTLDGSSFEYTATPIQILKGRMVASVIILIYVLSESIFPPGAQAIVGGLFAIGFIFFFPWLVIKGLQFNARYSNYRNIHFDFKGSYKDAFKYFILLPIASLTIILIPYVWQRKNKFFVGNSFYGTESFSFDAGVKEYYPVFGVVIGIIVGLALFAGVIIAASGGFSSFVLLPAFYLLGALTINAYFKVKTHNILYNHSEIKQHGFSGDYEFKSYLALLFKNTVGIVFTLGLYIPWAKIRTAQYHAEHTTFIASEPLNTFVAAEKERVNSLAEGLADVNSVFDVGVGI